MKHKSVVLVSVIGLASACVILIVFTYKRYTSQKRGAQEKREDDQHTDTVGEKSHVKHEDNDEQNVSQTESLTSYESFDSDDTDSFSSVLASSSEKSCVSTDADDRSPFPVGEISTYSRQIDADSPSVDFHELLNSPVIDDKRMIRSPMSPEVRADDSGFENGDITDGPEAKLQSIVVTYHTIVPPLKPNTGKIIPVPKM